MINIAYFALTALFFVLQLIICFRTVKKAVRFLPFHFIFFGYVLAFFCAAGVFGSGGGFIDGGSLAGLIIAVACSFAAVGDALAWVIYALINKRRKSED